jgi:3-hydroxymyristoyl/3-hydroxydecanoyl-(acyl carrier protein) dehydratase
MSADPQVLGLIPHRPPFLFVDEIVSEDADGLVARRTWRPDEDVLQGALPRRAHHPGRAALRGGLPGRARSSSRAAWRRRARPAASPCS